MSTACVNTISGVRPVPRPRSDTAPKATSRLRLTRRGRAVLTALLATPLVLGVGAVALAGSQAAASAGASQTAFRHVTVSSGESLWQIAEKIAPAADPRDVVAAFVDLNQLPDTTVMPGERLAIPTRYAH